MREVVVDDALGLGSELEAAMARHVEHYRDEWADTLDDPDKLGRFVSFVNAPGTPDHTSRSAPSATRPSADAEGRWSSARPSRSEAPR